MPSYFEFESKSDILECTKILRNFYNYLIHHSVCPEYVDQILAARDVCDMAEDELPKIIEIIALLPGAFNIACCKRFETPYAAIYDGDNTWEAGEESTPQPFAMTAKRARQVYSFGMVAYGYSQDHAEHDITDVEGGFWFEVTEILPSSVEIRNVYKPYESHVLEPPGKLICKPWTSPQFSREDLPQGYKNPVRASSYEFLMEDKVLERCFVGMKWQGNIYTLSCGLSFIDSVNQIYPSFYTLLRNELFCNQGARGKYSPWREAVDFTRAEQLEIDASVDAHEDPDKEHLGDDDRVEE